MRLTEREAREYQSCAADVLYFTRKYVHIKTMRGKRKWKPYPGATGDPDWQTRLLGLLQDGRNVVILKSRQVGASWTVAIFVSWLILFRPDVEILLLSQKEQKAIKLLAKVKFISRNLPAFIRREACSDTQTRFAVVHRRYGREVVSESSVDSLTTTGESGRGDTARLVFLDELAHVDNAEETWTAIKPTTSHGGQIVAASSPKGNAGPFPRLWFEADAGDSDFVPMKVHYTDCGFDEEWLKNASSGMTQTQINQEFELMFLGTGTPAFNPVQLEQCCFFDGLPPELQELVDKSTRFATGVDSAEIRRGRGIREKDFHAITSFNEYGIQVATEASQMTLDEWAGKTVDYGGELVEIKGYVSKWHEKFPGLMFIEENGAGLTVENRHQLPDDGLSDVAIRRTTPKSKPRLVNQFSLALAGKLIVITDKQTYYQLMVFEDLGSGKYSAPEGMKDDLVMAALEAYDALIEMGGYEFDMSNVSAASETRIVSPLDADFEPGAMTLPDLHEFMPGEMNIPDWIDLDPRGTSIAQLRETLTIP